MGGAATAVPRASDHAPLPHTHLCKKALTIPPLSGFSGFRGFSPRLQRFQRFQRFQEYVEDIPLPRFVYGLGGTMEAGGGLLVWLTTCASLSP